MQCTITIQMDNAAFELDPCGKELARILLVASNKAAFGNITVGQEIKLFDANGNAVGKLKVTK